MKKLYNSLLQKAKTTITPIRAFIKSRPFTSLYLALAILLALIVVNSFLNRPPAEKEALQNKPKEVRVYRVGSAPKIAIQAQIEKSGVVTITALASGVVQSYVGEPGTRISRGQTLVTMSSNYQGGNLPALQLSLAAATLKNVNDSYQTNKDLIAKQKELASKIDENSDKLRDISAQSINESTTIINLNDEIIKNLDEQITAGTNTNSNKQLKSQFLSANSQLRQALRNTEYSSSSEKIPADIANIQKDMTYKQLEIQEKALELSQEVSRLQYQIAAVAAATMTPSSPFAGTIQRVHVKVGQAVNPGTPLMTLSQVAEEDPITAVAYVPATVAGSVSMYEPSVIQIGNFTFDTYPTYVSQDAVQGTLYAVYYTIPDIYNKYVVEKGYVTVQIPVGTIQTGAAIPYIPIDSVYQTATSSTIFVVGKDSKVVSRTLILGNVNGGFVEVIKGLEKGDAIILDRTVISGEQVKAIN